MMLAMTMSKADITYVLDYWQRWVERERRTCPQLTAVWMEGRRIIKGDPDHWSQATMTELWDKAYEFIKGRH